ncbi:MAG: hypothetical protein MZV65_01175 [Chromatiales bacterium]|nr:hypothetical protein [Chromatiales bacterium]
MAMFGFVYLWYLMVGPGAGDLARLPQGHRADWRGEHAAPRAGSTGRWRSGRTTSARSALRDRRQGRPVHHRHRHPVGVPAARLRRVHLRLGQGEPVVVHAADADRLPVLRHGLGHRAGHARLHGRAPGWRGAAIDMACLDTIARYLFYAFIIDFSLEMLDLIHRIYEADESFQSLDFMVQTQAAHARRSSCRSSSARWCRSALLAPDAAGPAARAGARRCIYATAGVLTLIGIFAMRWNVVIGGQLFSKSFLGYTTYKMEWATREGRSPRSCCSSCRW